MTTEFTLEMPLPSALADHDVHNSAPGSASADSGSGRGRRPMNRVSSTSYGADGPCGNTVGERLVQRRLELNLTQAEVAVQVKIQPKSGPNKNKERTLSRNAYCIYERGRHVPSLELLRGLAAALDVSPAWLAFGA